MNEKETYEINVNDNLYANHLPSKEVVSSLIMVNYDDLKYMSVEGLKEMMKTIYELIESVGGTVNKKTKYIISTMCEKGLPKESWLTFIYNQLLTADGHGLLPGFGVGICETTEGRKKTKKSLWLNPEKNSVSTLI